LFFAIALPWYIAVQIKVPQFFKIFFIQHNLERFGTNLYQHSQPFWYYIPIFLLGLLPWTVFAVTGLVEAVRDGIPVVKGHCERDKVDWLQIFLLLWIFIPIIFFSISRSKLPGYILPAVPPAAVLTADYLHRSTDPLKRWRLLLHAVICGVIIGGALFAPWRMLKQHPSQSSEIWIAVTTAAIAVMVLLLTRQAGLRGLRFATLVPVVLALAFLLKPAAPVLDQVTSARSVAFALHLAGAPRGELAVFNVKREVEYGLNYYRNQPVSRYERDGVPAVPHVVIAKEGSGDAVQALNGNRQVQRLGTFPPQHLEFFWVSNTR
jgi:4-amino-4-deoxy-L-arabinose transferase-like glycosyltransferase